MRSNEVRRVLFLLLAWGAALSAGGAQDLRFSRIAREGGSGGLSVSGIAQDSRGFLWFGTKNGLSRYDGSGYISYTNDPVNENSLSHNLVQTVFMDAHDVLWLGTYRGLNRFDTGTKRFKRYVHDSRNPSSLSNDIVTAVRRDGGGRLWVGTMDGLNLLDEKTGRFTRYRDVEGGQPGVLPDDAVRSILETRDGILWVGTYGGLFRYDPKTDSFSSFSKRLPSENVAALSEDSRGSLWVGCWGGGLVRIGTDRKTVRSWSLPDNRVSALLTAFDGTVYAGTGGGGLVVLDSEKGTFAVYRADELKPFALAGDVVCSLFKDEAGLLWVGTDGGGVHKADPSRGRVDLFSHDPFAPGSLSKGAVLSVLRDSRGRLWVGSRGGGLNRLDPGSSSFAHYRFDAKNPRSLSDDTVNGLMEDESGSIWAATSDGLNRWDAASDSFERFRGPDQTFQAIAADARGRHWYGYYRKGAERYDPKTGERLRFLYDPKNPRSLSDNLVYFIKTDSRGETWLGTNGGLNRYDSESGGFVRYLPGDTLRCMMEDSKGRLWFGTAPGGLALMDRKTGKFERFSKSDGLPDDNVFSILEDGGGRLWLGTGGGLCVFDPASRGVKIPDVRDGPPGSEFSSGCCVGADGELFFGGAGGLNRISSSSLNRNQHCPPVRITSFKVFDREIPFGDEIADAREIRLSHRENFISIEFSALDFSDPPSNRYAYMLEGYDKGWINAGTRRRASYTDLPGGSYVFRVKGSNNHGVWNEDGARLRLTVTPVFWATPAAFVLYFAALFFFVAAVLAWASREQRLRLSVAELSERRRIGAEFKAAKERAEAADKAKSEFLANLSHEIRTPMNAVLGYASILAEKMADDPRRSLVEVIDRSGRSLLALLNDALDLSRMDAGKARLHSSPLRIRSLVSDLREMFRLRADEKGLSLSADVDSEIPEVILGDQTKLRQILVNLIGNAIKFTEKGEVRVFLSARRPDRSESGSNPLLEIRVSDTGIGLSAEALDQVFEPFYQQEQVDERYGGTGLGLTIVKRLTEELGGTIKVESEPGKGSVFTALIPGLRAAAAEDGAVADASDSAVDDRRLDGTDLLIVEDDPVNRDIMARMLESRGASVRTARDGEEGLRSVEIRRPDAVLADLRMPKVDGFAFLEALRNHPPTRNLPVLIVTADLRAETRSRLAGFGSAMVVPKPVDRSMLLDCLESVIPGRLIRASDQTPGPVPVPALKYETLRAELGDVKAARAAAALAGPALTARKAISAALIVDEWSAFAHAVEAVFVESPSREIGLYAGRIRSALAAFDVEELARLRAEFDELVRDVPDAVL